MLNQSIFRAVACIACATYLSGCLESEADNTTATPDPSAPIASLSSDSLSIAYNGDVTLSWSSSNADICQASGAWSGSKPIAGSEVMVGLTVNSEFELTCSGPGGTATDAIVVQVAPEPVPALTFFAQSGSVPPNGTTNLEWNASNVSSCSASGDWSGNKSTAGVESVGPLTSDSEFVLTCDGSTGSVSGTVNIVVNAANIAPVAHAGPDQGASTGSLVTLDGTGSTDANGDTLTFSWTLIQRPPNSVAVLSDTSSAEPSFLADVDGDYEASLIVSDGALASTADTVVISSVSVIADCTSNTIHCVDDTAGSNQEYSTIQTAVDISQPGDTVLVFDGDYAGFRVSSSGTSGQRIKIVASALNANIVSPEPFGSNPIRIQDASYITIDGLNINRAGSPNNTNYDYACIAARGANVGSPMRSVHVQNTHLANCAPAGMYLSNVADLRIYRNEIRDTRDVGGNSGMGIYVANAAADNAEIRENIITGSGTLGIHFNGDSSVGGDGIQSGHLIQRNVFDRNGTNAINMDGVQDVRIENNLVTNNTKHGIRGYQIDGSGGPKNWIVVNNTFFNNESPIKATDDAGGHTIFNNIVASNIDNSFLMNAGSYSESSNLFSTEPNQIFSNVGGGDLTLKSGTAAVDGGVLSFDGHDAPTDDLSSTQRTGNPDIGSFELGSTYPTWY